MAGSTPNEWFGVQDERTFVFYLSVGMVVMVVPVLAALLSGARAYYGRYSSVASALYGWPMNGKLAWVLQVSGIRTEPGCVLRPSSDVVA